MKKHTIHSSAALLPAIVSTLLLSALAASAGDAKWTGDPGNETPPLWSNSSNWDPATVPVAGDNLIFEGGTQTVNTNDLVGRSFGWLRFNNGDFLLGGNAITLTGSLTNTSGNNTVELPLTLGSTQKWEVPGGSGLTASGSLSLGANSLTLLSDGSSTLGGVAGAVVSGTGSVTKEGYGTLLWNAANSTLTGGIVVNGGILQAFSGNWTASLFANVTPRTITINAAGTMETRTHSLGGLGAAFYSPTVYMNGGVWQLNNEALRR